MGKNKKMKFKKIFLVFFFLISFFSFSQTQISVGNQVTTFSGSIRGYYFTAPTNFTICGLQVPTDASLLPQTIRVVRFTAGPPPAFAATTNNFIQLFSVTNFAGGIAPCNIPVTTGQVIGVYGVRGNCVNSYGPANFVTNIMGFPVTLYRSGMQSCPTGGQPMANIWYENSYISRTWMYINCCTVTATISSTNPTCNNGTNGSATVTPTGTAPFTYSWNTNPVQTTQTATNLPAGTYTVTVTGSGGCSTTATVTLTNPPPIVLGPINHN